MLVNNFADGGFNGNLVTVANSGAMSGSPFSAINKSGAATLTFDSSQAAHGALSYHCVAAAGELSYAILPGAASSISYAARFYLRLASFGNQLRFLQIANGAAFGIDGSGKFAVRDSNGTIVKSFATTPSLGVWYRVELELTRAISGTDGYLAARYFLGDATSPAETGYSSNVQNTGFGAYGGANFGVTGSVVGVAGDLWIDDLAVVDGTTTPIGPPAPRTSGITLFYPAQLATPVTRTYQPLPTYQRSAAVKLYGVCPPSILSGGQLWPRGA